MAARSIITPVERNADGSVRQKAIVTGAMNKKPIHSKIPQYLRQMKTNQARTPLRRKSGITPMRPNQSVQKKRRPLQEAGIFPIKPQNAVTYLNHGPNTNRNANSTFEVPNNQQKKSLAAATKSSQKSSRNMATNKKVTLNPNPTTQKSKPQPSKLPVTFATKLRRSSMLATNSPLERKQIKSRIPVPINTRQSLPDSERSIASLMQEEKDLVERLDKVRDVLRTKLADKYQATAMRAAGFQQTCESPSAAFNIRPASRRSSLVRKKDVKATTNLFSSPHAEEDNTSITTFPGTPTSGDDRVPLDILLSVTRSRTPGSLFENYRRTCAYLRSPRLSVSVGGRRRSRSLSTHRRALENSVCERVMFQLNNLFAS